jgi:hypothetical protein
MDYIRLLPVGSAVCETFRPFNELFLIRILGSVSKVEVGWDRCHTGSCVESVPTQGVPHDDIYRSPMPSLPKGSSCQARYNGPRNPAVPVPEYHLCQEQFSSRLS